MPFVPRKKQVSFALDHDEWNALVRLGSQSGLAPCGVARSIVLDVLRDDAVAHGEKEKRNAVA